MNEAPERLLQLANAALCAAQSVIDQAIERIELEDEDLVEEELKEVHRILTEGKRRVALAISGGRTPATGVFTCDCGASHSRGPINGGTHFRCLRCGNTTDVSKRPQAAGCGAGPAPASSPPAAVEGGGAS